MWIRSFLLLGLIFLLFSCTAPEKPKVEEVATGAPQVIAKEAWQIKWDNWLEKAKKEGRVSIYATFSGGVRDVLIRAFKDKYGIDLEIVTGLGGELAAKISAEKRAGIHSVDLYIGGGDTPLRLLNPQGYFTNLEPALILPEVLDGKAWWLGELDWLGEDKTLLYALGYTHVPLYLYIPVVRPEDIKSYRDLLDPKWKGKIAIKDPTITGSGGNWVAVVGMQIMGLDFVRELARQEPVILRDDRLLAEWLARGRYPIAINIKPEVVDKFIKAGAPVKRHTPEEGTHISSGSSALGLLEKAPHPNAARIFANWYFSKEGQTIFSKAMGVQSGRIDVPTDHLDPGSLRIPGMKYYDIHGKKARSEKEKSMELAKEIYGHLIR